jgi:HemK-related putative methylase
MDVVNDFTGIRYIQDPNVYPVDEDSLLLIKAVRPYLKDSEIVMEMGCGTGLLTMIASKNGIRTIAVDREPKALTNLRRNLQMNGLSAELLLSDLYCGVPRSLRKTIDLICFNPPYLNKMASGIDSRHDLPLSGGLEGWELTRRFLEGSRDFLSDNGRIIFISYPDWKKGDLDPDEIFEEETGIALEKDLDGELLEVRILRFSP